MGVVNTHDGLLFGPRSTRACYIVTWAPSKLLPPRHKVPVLASCTNRLEDTASIRKISARVVLTAGYRYTRKQHNTSPTKHKPTSYTSLLCNRCATPVSAVKPSFRLARRLHGATVKQAPGFRYAAQTGRTYLPMGLHAKSVNGSRGDGAVRRRDCRGDLPCYKPHISIRLIISA